MALYPRYYDYYSKQITFADTSTQTSAGISVADAQAQTTAAIANIIAVGAQAALQSVLPLNLGEIYVATDTGNLFIGTPGSGAGYIQVADMSQVTEKLDVLIQEIRALRLATVALDNTLLPQDYEPFGKQIKNGDAVGDYQ